MRVLWLLAAWSVLAVLATMCFALGGSIGYRRGVRDTVAQLRDRRTGKTGCRPLPANYLRRRTSGYARPGARARRSRWPAERPAAGPVGTAPRSRLTTAAAASVAAVLLIGVPGTAIGATTARPGESLWKVKLGLERVRLAVAASPERNAQAHVDLASARLSELAGLVGSDVTPRVVGEVNDDLHAHATAADDALGDVGPPAARDELERRLSDVKQKQELVLGTLLGDTCGDADECVALEDTPGDTVEGEPTTDEPVALAVPVEQETDGASDQPTSVAQADAAAAAPSVDAVAVPSDAAAVPSDAAAVPSDAAAAPPDTSAAPPDAAPSDDETTGASDAATAASDDETVGAPAAATETAQPGETAATASEPPATDTPTPPEPARAEPSEPPSPTPSPSPSGAAGGPGAGSPATELASPPPQPPTGPLTSPDALEAQNRY